jgi:predicted transcriptional regulator
MNLTLAIEIAGSKSKLAKLLGISRAAVTMWDEIPAKRVKQLKELKEWQTHFIGEQAKIQSASSSSVSKTNQL